MFDGECVVSASSLFEHPGVCGILVGNANGEFVGEIGSQDNAEALAAVIAVLGKQLGGAGETLGLGPFATAILKAPGSSRILAQQNDTIALLELRREQPTGDIEELLRQSNWSSRLQEGIADLSDDANPIEVDIDEGTDGLDDAPIDAHSYEPPRSHLQCKTPDGAAPLPDALPLAPPPLTDALLAAAPPLPDALLAAAPPLPDALLAAAPPLPDALLAAAPLADALPLAAAPPLDQSAKLAKASAPLYRDHRVPRDAKILDDTWDIEQVLTPLSDPIVDLRRALVRGDETSARAIGTKLFDPPGASGLSEQKVANRDALRVLLEGITAARAGDGRTACAQWRALVPAPTIDPSVLWARQIWLARTQGSTGLSLERARIDADTALELASVLDPDARAVSLLVEAETAVLGDRHEEALWFVKAARELFAMSDDADNLAQAWLLEARALACLQREEESRSAARTAHSHQPSWAAPSMFLAGRALSEGQPDEARALLRPWLAQTERSADVERLQATLDMVRDGDLTNSEATDFLEMVEGRPDGVGLFKLEQLAQRLPARLVIREALACMLLRLGEYERAAREFGAVSTHADLPVERRSSIAVTLDYLSTERARYEAAATELRESTPGPADSLLPPSSRSGAPQSLRHSSSPAAQFELGILARSRASGTMRMISPSVCEPLAESNPPGSILSGSLRQFCLADLLEFLRNHQRTGTLVCASDAGVGELHLQSGRLIRGSSPNSQRFDEWLVQCGALSRVQLEDARSRRPADAASPEAEAMLVEERLVSPELVREALRRQVDGAVRELMTWIDGQFAFDAETLVDSSPPEVAIAMDPMAVLLDISKEIDKVVG